MSARDVIAEAIGEIQIHPTTQPQKLRCEPIVSDIILAALDAAGFEIIPKRNAIQRQRDDLIEQWKRARSDAAKESKP